MGLLLSSNLLFVLKVYTRARGNRHGPFFVFRNRFSPEPLDAAYILTIVIKQLQALSQKCSHKGLSSFSN